MGAYRTLRKWNIFPLEHLKRIVPTPSMRALDEPSARVTYWLNVDFHGWMEVKYDLWFIIWCDAPESIKNRKLVKLIDVLLASPIHYSGMDGSLTALIFA